METNPNGAVANDFGGGEGDVPPPNEVLFSIGEIAREFGVTLRTLRFYEDRGLLRPQRRGTKRLYSERDRAHLQMILKGKQLGFTLTGIQAILASRGEATGNWALELNLNPEQIKAQIRQLERQRADLELALTELREAHQRAEKLGESVVNAA
ncbi:MAG: MerR family transcriptional regulator [Methylovirgula sp.]